MIRGRDFAGMLRSTRPGVKYVILAAVVLLAGAVAASLSSFLPLLVVLGIVVGVTVFILVYRDIHLGIVLYFILNLTIPQAGPGISLGIRAPVVGERGVHFNLHEIVMAMALAAWIIQAFMKKAPWRERSPLTIPVIVYVLVSILSCFVGLINGSIPALTLFRFVRTTLFAYMFFVVINNVRTREQLGQLMAVFLVCTFLVSAFGVLQQLLGQRWSEMVAEKFFGRILGYPKEVNYVAGEGLTQVYRINSTFLHPNTFGGYLAFAFPFYISLLWYYRRFWMRVFLLVGLAINVFCLVYTGSRAAWIAVGFIILIYGVLGLSDRRIVLVVGVALIILLMLVVIIKPPEFIRQRFVSQSAKLATTGRLIQYQLAWGFFLQHPIFGLGIGMEGQEVVEGNIRRTWVSVENLYLTYLVSQGLVGLASFLLLLAFYWALLLWVRNYSLDDPLLRYGAEALMLGMVGFAASNLFAAWLLFAVPMITLFWFYIGLAGSFYNVFRAQKEGW